MSRGVSGCGTGLVAGRDSASPRLLTPTETKEASHARNLCSSLFRGRPGHRRIRCDGGCNSPNRSRHPSPHRLQFQHGFLIRCERNRLTLSFTVVGIAHEWLLFVVRHGANGSRPNWPISRRLAEARAWSAPHNVDSSGDSYLRL
jgi:hypothetical protein